MDNSNKLSVYESKEIQQVKDTMDGLYKTLSKKPDPKHIKKNKYANNSNYVEIGYIEAQLDRLFLSWDWIVDSVQLIANGIVVTGKLVVKTVNGNTITRSGVAGVEIQTLKNATSLTPETISSKALDRDPGRAEAYALKNAASKLGNVFGRGLNRDFNHEHIPSQDIIRDVFGQTDGGSDPTDTDNSNSNIDVA